ncbi:MAG TPA: DUF4232 domain-containing protein [Acidimicrobiales bacterium]|nr:DUF4232 domain-containing protein [Acidimicrobiales bacterium]
MGNRRRLVGALLVAGALLGLSACSPSQPTSSTSTSTTTTTATSTSSTTSTTLAGGPTCSTGALSLSASGGGASAGSSVETFTVTNNGPATCRLDGYPSLTFFGPTAGGGAGAGAKLAITDQDAGPAPAAVTLKTNGSAEFLVIFSDVPVGGGCTTVASVEMAPPGSSESVTAPVSFSPCGGTVKVYAFGVPGSENP